MEPNEKVNILLVDDQPGKLLSYEAMLAQLGENLIKANSGKEALEHLLRTEIAVVLMDVSMPDLDGFELAKIIHGHPRYQKTAIIFVSAVHSSDLDRLKGYESGAVHYVSVPVIPELLRAEVSVFVDLYRKTRQLDKLTRELEDRVADRTAELEESVTKQFELTKRLRDADRRKDEFLALLGHELRNPLAPVTNAVAVMRMKGGKDPDVQWCVNVIERQVSQLARLVDELLDVSRVSQGKIKLHPTKVDLSTVVHGALETSRPLIDARHHAFSMSLPENPVFLMGDSMRLIQVVANLLNNAAKYQNEHGRIELTAQRFGDVVEIRVKDLGIGIARDALPNLFELFTQGERSTDLAQGGLGIGLSLVRSLVEMHGGTATATSEGRGLGSEFIVSLPVLAESTPEVPAEPAPKATPAGGRMHRILVVDDNRDAAETVAVLLRLCGHEVMVAHEASTALAIAATTAPSVALLDIGLPNTDGYELCRRLRQQGMAGSGQIIAMTGYGHDRDRQRSREAGFDAHTVKPVVIEEILRLLH